MVESITGDSELDTWYLENRYVLVMEGVNDVLSVRV